MAIQRLNSGMDDDTDPYGSGPTPYTEATAVAPPQGQGHPAGGGRSGMGRSGMGQASGAGGQRVNSVADRQLRYMAQSVMMEEAGISWLNNFVIGLVTVIVAAFIGWSIMTDVEEIAITHGAIVPSGSVQVVQHLEGGIVRNILVKERQLVEAGQPLIRMDPAQARSELEQLEARRATLQLRAERLRAVAENREPDFSITDQTFSAQIQDQMEIYTAQIDRWDTQKAVLEKQVFQKQEEISAVKEQQRATRDQIDLLDNEIDMRAGLVEQGYSSKVVLLAVQRQKKAAESELARLQGQGKSAAEKLREVRSRLADLDNNVRENALNEMGSVTAELAQLDEAMTQTADRVNRLDVVSPVRGLVQEMKIKTVGAVVPAGGELMNIVPIDDTLQVETKITTRDIGHVETGMPVSIKVTSFDFARYGSVEGTLDSVSPTTLVDENDGSPYYRGLVSLSQNYVGKVEGQNTLLPGMTVQADIVTGNKTLFEYLLKPIFVSLNQAFHER
ncbi:MAG: HlyD family type I secretion periplasmic adaptor subunit [Magnetovibrionaceae bacterium]